MVVHSTRFINDVLQKVMRLNVKGNHFSETCAYVCVVCACVSWTACMLLILSCSDLVLSRISGIKTNF